MCKCSVFVYVLVIICSLLLCFVNSFNIETINYVMHKGADQSMFGFSVATHKEQGRSWVIVGAPKAQENGSTITQGGVVYKCSAFNEGPCEEIHFHQNASETKALDDKNYQWFGATISSAGPDGPVVACAPRYVWFTTSREERRDPVGTCYIARNNFQTFSEYSPCRTSLFGYHRQGSCQAGFSAGISKDGRRLFVGAPGSWYWQGQAYSIDPSTKFPYTPGIFGEAFGFGTKGQVIQQNLDDRPAVVSTPEGPATDDDSYMGYSMVVGDFNGEGTQGAAVGMPKAGRMLEGKVLLYTWDLTNYLNLTGKQFGAYFGYSLATSDVDGDNRDDLIIGAPLHVEKNTDMKYEVGRVYVAYQGRNGSYAKGITLDGYNSKSRFGLSVCGLGDLNLDKYGDFAVGAPYDGPNERGAVYIFQGSKNGVITKYSQVIYAEDIQQSFGTFYPLSTFGFSISGGLDLDGNDYPDVAIGSYLTDNAFFFRTRPVVRVEAKLTFLARPKQVYLEQKNCLKPGDPSKLISCTTIELCMRYTGVGTPPRVEMDLQYLLDTKVPGFSRMYLEGRENDTVINRTLSLHKDAPMDCSLTDTIYLKDPIVDKLTELEIEVKYHLKRYNYPQQTYRDPHSILEPLVDLSNPAVTNDTINIYKNCGDDNICVPNLYLSVEKKVDKYLYQVGVPLQFEVLIINSAENAYDTKLFIHLPEGIAFKVANEIGKENRAISCKSSGSNETIYNCDIGNPLTKDTPIHLNVEVEPLRHQQVLKPTYDFYFNITSANPGHPRDLINATRHVSVSVWVNAFLQIESKSTPSTVYYNVSQHNTTTKDSLDNQMGPLVIHSYTVTNKGSADIEEAELFIVWPLETLSGEDLLYLLEEPHTLGGVTCEKVNVNPKNLQTSQLRDVWSMIGIDKNSFLANSTQSTLVENGTIVPGQIGDTRTQTITTFTFYNGSNNIAQQKTYIGEPGRDEFWGNISAIASEFTEPITIKANSSTLITRYIKGIKFSEEIVPRPLGPNEKPTQTYKIHTNITTEIHYYDQGKNLIFTQKTHEQPGSLAFKNLIKQTKENLPNVVSVDTLTTKKVTVTTTNGKRLHEETFIQTGTEDYTNREVSRVNTITYVTFFDPDKKVLHKEALTVDPTSSVFWEQVNKFISKFNKPVTVHTTSEKVTIYYINGVEVRREEKPVSVGIGVEGAFTTHTETSTEITVSNLHKDVLYKDTILGSNYNDRLVNIVKGFKEPLVVHTKTTHTITYKRLDGRVMRVGTYIEERTETVTPSQLETTSTSTVTKITIYDLNNNVLHTENVSDATGSEAYWEKINKIIANYHEPVVIHKKVITIVTYYLNGKPIRTEPDYNVQAPDTTLTTQMDVNTVITVYNSHGNLLYNNTVFEKVSDKYVEDLVKSFSEAITLKIRTTTIIKYISSDGRLKQTGTYIQEQTKSHNPNPQNSVTTTVTTVTITDLQGNVLMQENVTAVPNSAKYWEGINQLISWYDQPVTVTKVTKTYVTYYINGETVTQEGGQIGESTVLNTQSEIKTELTAKNHAGRIIYHETLPGTLSNKQISDIVSRLRESSVVTIRTVVTISYLDVNGRVVKTGTHTQERTETYNKNSNETETSTTITTVTFHDLSGNILHQENVTEVPDSKAYWEKITRLISSYSQPIEIHKKTQTINTYYVNGFISRTEVVEDAGATETTLSTQSEISTIIEVFNAKGHQIFKDTLIRPATSEDIANIVNRHREHLTIKIKTTHTITYRNRQGHVVRIGTYIETRTETHAQKTNETSSTSTITTIIFYDQNRNILHQEEIREEPYSDAYWEKVNQIISRYREVITLHITTRKVITYFINGRAVRTQDVPTPSTPVTCSSHTDASSHITVYNSNKNALYQEVVAGEKGTIAYNTAINNLIRRYNEPISIKIKTTYTITYRSLDGKVLHTGHIKKEETESHNQNQHETKRVSTVTTINYYGPSRNLLHRETIGDEPGTPVYWEHIKITISRINVPVTIYTNTTKLITYYVNGQEVRNEHVDANAGIFETPFSAIVDIKNVITYFDSQKNVLFTENINGELTAQDRQDRMASFTKRYPQSFTIETNTTKTITFRSSSGQILHTVSFPFATPTHPNGKVSRTISQTTFIVYGSDGNVLHTETIQGEPGSSAYNEVVAKIIHRFSGPINIYTNSTKTITYYSDDGIVLDHKSEPEARSTIQKEGGSAAANARTTVTFYGPDGQAIHSDTISGAPGPDLQTQLGQIASRYGGVVKSYGGYTNGGSIGSDVTLVDTPYPGNKPITNQNHFTDFSSRSSNNQTNSWSPRESSHGYGLQNLGEEGLASFGKGKGFRTGGLEFGVGNSGNVDRHIDTQARNNFNNYNSYDGSHNYLSSHNQNLLHGRRRKREDKTNEEIKTLSNCTTSTCLLIKCTTGPIQIGYEVHLAIRSRVIIQTLKNISVTQPVKIQSLVIARISQFQEIQGAPSERKTFSEKATTLVMAPHPVIKPDIVPLWVVVLSAVAGTLILLLLIFLLYMCGFFNRNRPSDAPERQPLNRNGHYQHGDEAL